MPVQPGMDQLDQLENLSVNTLTRSSQEAADCKDLSMSGGTTDVISKSRSGGSLASSQATQRTKCGSDFSSVSGSGRGATLSGTTPTPGARDSSSEGSNADRSAAPSSAAPSSAAPSSEAPSSAGSGTGVPFVNAATRGGGKTVLGGIAPSMQGLLRRRARFSGWKSEHVYYELRSTTLLAFAGTGGSKSSGNGSGPSSGHGQGSGGTGGGSSLAILAAKILQNQQKQVGDWSWSMDLAGAERVLSTPTLSKKGCFSFSVEFPSGSKKKTLVLGANSFQGRERWIAALDRARHCVHPQDFVPFAVIGEGHFGKVLLVRWKNGAAAVRKKSPSSPFAAAPETQAPRLVEEGKVDGEEEKRTQATEVVDNDDRYLAVKEVELKKGTSLPSVLNERQILGVLREHPFVVTLRCAWRRGNFLYYGLDFLPGADLFELFRRNPVKMDKQAARVYGGQMALALEHLHAHGICYRDLKPENILVDAKGNLCLADMGLSKILGTGPDALRTSTVCGTRAYLAPEMVLRKPYGFSVDFWQFGCFVYELYAGHSPFWTPRSGAPSRANDQTVALILAGEINYPRSICADAKSFIRQLLRPEINSRLGCEGMPVRAASSVAEVAPAASTSERRQQGASGWNSVKQHAFFDDMDWEALLRGEIPAPLKPGAPGRSMVGNFAREYTRQRAGWGKDHPELRDSADKEVLFRQELMGFDFLRG